MASTIRGLFNDTTLTNLTVEGTESEVRLTPGHALHINLRNQAGIEIGTVANPLVTTSSGGGGGGVSIVDGSPFTAGVSSLAPTGGVFNDAVANLAAGTTGEVRLTAARSMHVMLRDAAGAALLGQKIMTQSLPVAIASDQNNLDINLHDGVGTPIGSVGGAINVNIASGGGSGFSVPDGTAWTAGATALVPTGGVFNDAAAVLSAGNEGTVRMTANRAFHINNRTAAGVELLGQQVMAGSLPVVIASNQSTLTIAGAVTVTSGSITTVPPANASTNIAQYGGVATSLGTKVAASSIPVTIASDQPAQAITGTVTANQGGAPWSVNNTQINGVAVSVNNGTANTGTQRVAIASDNTPFTVVVTQATAASLNAEVVGNEASGATDSGNPVKIGGIAQTTLLPTAVTSLQRVNAYFDSVGRQIMATAPRLLKNDQQTTLTTTTETTILNAVTGTFMDLCMLVITNSSASATTVTIRSGTGGTIKMIVDIAANGGAVIPLATPLIHVTANTPWTAQLGTAVTSIHIMAQAISNV